MQVQTCQMAKHCKDNGFSATTYNLSSDAMFVFGIYFSCAAGILLPHNNRVFAEPKKWKQILGK